MNKKTLIGIGVGAIAVGIFLLAVTNPNLRENKDTYFGFIETTQESPSTIKTVDCQELYDKSQAIWLVNAIQPPHFWGLTP